MTTEEAIIVLRSYRIPQNEEAIDMAISALKKADGDLISRKAVKEQMIKYGFRAPDMTVTEFVEDILTEAESEEEE